jgi:hypothetical protein
MHLAILSAALLAAAAPPAAQPPAVDHYSAGKADFASGDFPRALKNLDAAVVEATDDAAIARIQLLRGQCHSILHDVAKAEDAFAKALDADPEAKLDPTTVRPSTVSILDRVRERLTAELNVRANVADATATFDGKPAGALPLKIAAAPIGRHHLDIRAADGRTEAQDIVLRPRRSLELWIKFSAPLPPPTPQVIARPPPPEPPAVKAQAEPWWSPWSPWPLRPYADLRGTLDAMTGNPQGEIGLGVDVARHVLVAADFTVGHSFGLTARVTGSLPELYSRVGLYASVDVPVLFVSPKTAVGLGVALGVEFAVTPWLEPFVEIDGTHFLTLPDGYAADYLMLSAGARLRLP